MKIVNVVDEFHPYAGYENNVLSKFMVKLGHEYIILSTRYDTHKKYYTSFLGIDNIEEKDKVFEEKTGVKVIRNNAHCIISGRVIWKYREFKSSLKLLNPDIVFFCGNDTYVFILFFLLNRSKIIRDKLPFKVIADSHMLEMASKNRLNKVFYFFYRLLITPIIKKANTSVIRVQDDPFVMNRLGVPERQAPFISFGTDTILFKKDVIVKSEMRSLLGISEDAFVIIYAGKIDESKGGMFLAESIKTRFDTSRELVFVVVATARSAYEEMVINELKKSENRVILHDSVPYFDLASYYQMSDLAVYPKQCSLSFFDVQACGVPVLLEDNQINIDRISMNNGFLFRMDDIASFREMIIRIADNEDLDAVSTNATKMINEKYDYSVIALEYEKIFANLLSK